MYTIHDDIKKYKPVLALTQVLSPTSLHRLRLTFFTLATITGLTGTSLLIIDSNFYPQLFGASLIFAGLWVEQVLIYSYFNNYYFFGLNSIIGISEKKTSGITYEVAQMLLINEKDITGSFCNSHFGTLILLRAGINTEKLSNFLVSDRVRLVTDLISLPTESMFTVISLGRLILKQDKAFSLMLKEQGVTEEIFIGALEWVMHTHFQNKKRERWWSKDNLAKIQGIGRNWAYGTTFLLQKFSREINTSAVFSTLTQNNHAFKEDKIKEIEIALARAKASNVLVIGEIGVGTVDLIMEINRRMKAGKSLSVVENQQMILLDTNLLFATHKDKQSLEITLISLLNEAIEAGNVIIVIENLSIFIKEAEAMGVFIPDLLDPYLATSAMHIIATDTPSAYHNTLEPLMAFTRRFAEVLIDEPNLQSTVKVLQDVALRFENKYSLFFTFSAIKAITECANRYIIEGVMPDKAIELLSDISTRAKQNKVKVVDQNFVYEAVSVKTGIPTGPIKKDEKELLLQLENRLHERVIGQQKALDAIAGTMRRARAGIQTSDKPIGSFLFLGPTGVGKTETAKALAYIFFGNEGNMHRLDMSEFSGKDALNRLIGQKEESGILSDMLREHPYSVLLLDEFEKGSRTIHDLFLQILDEGIFTDGRGEKVNARNCIIIATSNAGSELIIRTINQRKEMSTLDQAIVDHIIKEGIYRPELLNRFDNIIIFDPLTIEEQGQIANLMLSDLYKRIKEKGYELIINQDLIDLMVKEGYDPKFGARPMQRVLQARVEEKIAQKIISGEINTGDTINLTKNDFI
ncbi:MAG: ATP-dependent Clp protease ATP-binding subunit ClpC [Parcubacteria bacterium OLB19]|nr:MAG: ATP-dependent Clp protease ATP-binding subunit ClpC [Parcubacteria bacterium OLB19]